MKTNNIPVKLIAIKDEDIDQRIDNFLCTQLKGVPKSMIYRIIRKGAVRVNKKRIQPKYKLQYGDQVRLPPVRIAKCKRYAQLSPKLYKIAAITKAILYEDDYLMILNKMAGIAVHGGTGVQFGIIESLRVLRSEIPFLELVHRLDRDTSGILMIAKKRSALRSLNQQLREQTIKKSYIALVKGDWPPSLQLIQFPLLKKSSQNSEYMVCVNMQGKPSETYFRVKERFSFATLVHVTPITGRTHQIRVHALHCGHPIACDNRYGDREFDDQLTKKIGLSRLFLHASVIKFVHPSTKETMKIKAPLDNILKDCLFKLRQKNIDN
ncbi:23S rRNA pseudouridine(955/2504/2580) synthase RluC [Candidatus Pantoea carbekii]|uniref:23S rRNA pseudouridine(955/2504/2580) synthase RluC n=1 Tax=Candidatus Pantoea carbekii TaxID=1235990 RepID=UPI0005C553E2|nr:23S rRNA pseudouridine(955/2504/2580) synthase RluC [Candidatus Pantoea carbekii]